MKKDWMWKDDDPYLVVWSKPTLVRRHLPHYDYLFFIDSDAIFIDHEQKVETLVQKYMKTKEVCILAGEDCLNKTTCWDKDNLNTGSMLFANNPQTLKILDHWVSAADKECLDWKYRHTREQMCLQILKEKHYPQSIKTVPYYEMNGIDGTWIHHYMAMSTEERSHFLGGHFQDLFQKECQNLYPQHQEDHPHERHTGWRYCLCAVATVLAALTLLLLRKKYRRA
jgi:hypothetical protein